MRFEELAYTVDGLPCLARFDARLTVLRIPEGERAAWVARLLGVLEGTRAGDGVSAVYTDDAGQRVRLDRDVQGSATLTDLDTGAELPYSAGHLSLDGRFDWFASIGIGSRAAGDIVVVGSEAFTVPGEYDRDEVEAMLQAARAELGRVERQRQAAQARWSRRDDLRVRIADLDEQLEREQAARAQRRVEAEAASVAAGAADGWWRAMAAVDDARRPFAARVRLDPEPLARALGRPTEVADDIASRAAACLTLAERRDELVAQLDAGAPAEVDGAADEHLRQLVDEVEPAFVDALAALADACRPFDVTIDAVRLEASGIGAAGIAVFGAEVLAEVAARVAEAADARLQQALEQAESDCRAARDHLAHQLAVLGLPTDGTDALAAAAEAVVRAAAEAETEAECQAGSDSALRTMANKRSRLAKALHRAERDLPDVAELTDRYSALVQEVDELEAFQRAGRRLLPAEEAEMVLLQRAARARRLRRHREPLPLVVDDALAPFATSDKQSLLGVVARLGETTQVVYLTDDPATLEWASSQRVQGEVTEARPDGYATVA